MKSSIKVDFRPIERDGVFNLEPVIAVVLNPTDDVRDGLLSEFFAPLGGLSSWLKVSFDRLEGSEKYITLRAIRAEDVESEMKIMEERLK